MNRRLEYVFTDEEYGDLINIVNSNFDKIGKIIHLDPEKNWSKAEMLSFLSAIKSDLEKANKILRGIQ